jgi:hypothetical protein
LALIGGNLNITVDTLNNTRNDTQNDTQDTTKTQEKKFGNESEYTYEDLLEGINSLLTDL